VALALVLGMSAGPAAAEELKTVVIINPDRVGFEPDRGLLRALFTLRVTVWPDGAPVYVFVLPDRNAVHDLFCREQLGTYPYVLRTVWDRKVYTGVGFAPAEVRSEEEMRQKVQATPGAIGYAGAAGTSFLPALLLEFAGLPAVPTDD
jgi:hypothetical protein